jgi:deoxyribodipyrimidine photo-lyase
MEHTGAGKRAARTRERATERYMTILLWFRQDLRLRDNPALAYAAKHGLVLPVFILDETPEPHGRSPGGAARWWLHHSLDALKRSLGGLLLRRGDPRRIIPELVATCKVDAVCWNRCYEPHAIERDTSIKAALKRLGAGVESFNASLMHEPWQIKSGDGQPYKVYTPFWRACLRQNPAAPQPVPRFRLAPFPVVSDRLDDWQLLPRHPDWAGGFASAWTAGEAAAAKRLNRFLRGNLNGYATLRDRPDGRNVSRMSPHLHWGEISPRQVWAATSRQLEAEPRARADGEKFLAELGWREFAYHLLYHFPDIPRANWKKEFDAFAWHGSREQLRAWQRGQTGYPLVDAGMRELWATGYMHNRVRMITASFLVKHLRIDWRCGEKWFWDTLVDADLANNVVGWQWVAGSGPDAAPYFRVFNPIEQGRKFDSDGDYVRRWCPELARLPAGYIHAPFEAPETVLKEAGVRLAETYPAPIVGHKAAREAALASYQEIRGKSAARSRP